MTLHLRELWAARSHLKDCVDNPPPRAMQRVIGKADTAVDRAITAVLKNIKAQGFKVDGGDACADLEAHIYSFLKQSNPEHLTVLSEAEKYGASLSE